MDLENTCPTCGRDWYIGCEGVRDHYEARLQAIEVSIQDILKRDDVSVVADLLEALLVLTRKAVE